MIRKSDKKKAPPLRVKLFLYLSVFFLFVILLLWVLQVVFMGSFYRAVSTAGMKRAAKSISESISDGDIGEAAYSAAEKTGNCVSVYMISAGHGTKISDAHIQSSCYIHNFISGDFLNSLYRATDLAGGSLTSNPEGDEGSEGGALIYSLIVYGESANYFIILNSESFPASASAVAVTVQLSLITVILIIGAAALAVLLSRKITAPVSSLCTESQKLAAGDYSVSFGGSDVLEINTLGRTLELAAAELERSNRLQRELVANVTHDLRTPLTMIKGYSEVMRDIPGEINAENLQVIIDESTRLSELVSDVLEVTQNSGGGNLNPAEFSLTDAVRSICDRYSEMLRVKGYSVVYESDGIDAEVIGDEVKLTQAFCNLLNNAVNFTGDDKKVTVRQYTVNGVCRTEVVDSGPGIPEDELSSIWDRYYRARDIQNKGVPGSGLGLAIVKRIMLDHHIPFGVRSSLGEGSVFWFEMEVKRTGLNHG